MMSVLDALGRLFGRGPARFEGLINANVSNFDIGVARNLITAITDNFVVSWRAADFAGSDATKSDSRHLTVALSPAARGRKVQITLEGSRDIVATPPPRVILRVGRQSYDAPLPNEDGGQIELVVEVATSAAEDILPIEVEVVIPRPDVAGLEAPITIQSLDVRLLA